MMIHKLQRVIECACRYCKYPGVKRHTQKRVRAWLKKHDQEAA